MFFDRSDDAEMSVVGHHGREGVPQNFELGLLEMLIILGVYFVIYGYYDLIRA